MKKIIKNKANALIAKLATFKALAANVKRLSDSELLETIKDAYMATATMSLVDYDDNVEKRKFRYKIEDIQMALKCEYHIRVNAMQNADERAVYMSRMHANCDIVHYYQIMRNHNDDIIRSYEYIGGTDPDAFDAMIAQMENDAAENGFTFDLQAHSIMAEPVTNKKFEMLANLAAMSTHVAELSDADFLDVIEEELTFEYIAQNANDDISQALLQPIGALIGAEIDNRLDHKDFIEAYDERYYYVGAQFDDVMRRHYFNLFIINEIGGTDPDAFDAMIAEMEKDAEARYYAEIHARVVNRRLCDIINLYTPDPDAFDAMIAQMEKDAAARDPKNGFTFDVQAHSEPAAIEQSTADSPNVEGDAEPIFPAAESIAPHMIVPTIAQAAEWLNALPDADLQAAYQLAVTTHAKMTILTKDRWIVDECLDAFAEEASARGINLIPCNDEPPITRHLSDSALLETISAIAFTIETLALSDSNEEVIWQNQCDLDRVFDIVKKYRPHLKEDAFDEERRAYQVAADRFNNGTK